MISSVAYNFGEPTRLAGIVLISGAVTWNSDEFTLSQSVTGYLIIVTLGAASTCWRYLYARKIASDCPLACEVASVPCGSMIRQTHLVRPRSTL